MERERIAELKTVIPQMMHCLVPNFIEENNWDHSTEKKHSRKRE
jgi:hypothetical protein